MTLAPDDPRHGTRNGYGNLGCRCQKCGDANAAVHLEYMRRTPAQREKHRKREMDRYLYGDKKTYMRARTAAMRRLRIRHQEEFAQMLREERARLAEVVA